jgi:N-acetylglucosaminyl-diphospho-decaprenol L-rhamnosyltransferase
MLHESGCLVPKFSSADVTAVIVTFNSEHCIESLSTMLRGVKNSIFVDNNSSDGTVVKISSVFPDAKIIRNAKNIGFGAANNKALSITETKFAFLVNPDCYATAPLISSLLPIFENYPSTAIAVPQILNANGGIEVNYRWSRLGWKSSGLHADGPCCVGFVSGAAMLVRLDLIKRIGLFDEQFFLYYEDEDLCERMFAHRLELVVAPNAQIFHRSRGSVRGGNSLSNEYIRGFHHAQSKIKFEKKYFGKGRAKKLRLKVLFYAIPTLVLRIFGLNPKYIARTLGRIVGLACIQVRP